MFRNSGAIHPTAIERPTRTKHLLRAVWVTMPEYYTCERCGSTDFQVETYGLVGADNPAIDSMVCLGCTERHDVLPKPAKIRPENDS